MLPVINFLAHALEEEEHKNQLRIERRLLREANDPFTLPDEHFQQLFRLTKELTVQLIHELQPFMADGERATRISISNRIFAALRFFATGNYQRGIGQEQLISMSQGSVSYCIKEVAEALEKVGSRWVSFPTTEAEKLTTKTSFEEQFQFPGVIGVIDGTHVAILEPVENQHLYLNRKRYNSKNVLIVCDTNLQILYINARYGGASSDSFIWQQSAVYQHMLNNYVEGDRNTWLLGDSGYPQEPWLMTPYPNPALDSPEARYNQAHSLARNCIERCIGLYKTRFRCLLKKRMLRYSPTVAGVIINACAVLHNMCVRNGVPFEEELEVEVDDGDLIPEDHEEDQQYLPEGQLTRDRIVQLFFNNDVNV